MATKVEQLEDGWLVQGTADVEQALTALMLHVPFREWMDDAEMSSEEAETRLRRSALPDTYRKLGPLPGSLAEFEGWSWALCPSKPGRGAFPGVTFDPWTAEAR